MIRDLYTQYLLACLLYIIAYCYAIVAAPMISNCPTCQPLEKVHRSCVVGLNNQSKIISDIRGDKYYIGVDYNVADLNSCLVTFWGFTHFILYVLLGVLVPDLFVETFVLGVGFEL